jgi:hypothetical protein
MRAFRTLVLISIISAAGAAFAQGSNSWRVSGAIGGRSFVIDCRLDQPGGLCVDTSNRKNSHPLTSLTLTETEARWGFTTKWLVARIPLRFEGRIEGERMNGKVTGGGQTGSFTAVRS